MGHFLYRTVHNIYYALLVGIVGLTIGLSFAANSIQLKPCEGISAAEIRQAAWKREMKFDWRQIVFLIIASIVICIFVVQVYNW